MFGFIKMLNASFVKYLSAYSIFAPAFVRSYGMREQTNYICGKNGTDSISMPYDVYLDSDLVGIIFDVGKYSFVYFIQRKLHE